MCGVLTCLAAHATAVAIPKSWNLSVEEIDFCAPNSRVSRTVKGKSIVSQLCDFYGQAIAREHGCNLPDEVKDYIHFRN